VLTEVYTDTVACIYNVDGNCKGMLTPERLNILRKAFDRAKCSGLHDHVQPPPISFASELGGLIARKDTSASKHTNKKIKDSFARILPSHITAAFQKWALVTKENMASPLDHDLKIPHYWSEHPRDKVFGANTNAFSSRFSGFSICHPNYHEKTMLLATRHAIYSVAVSTEETATITLLPSWNKDMTTNPYALLCRKYPHICKFLGTIPSDQLQYAKVPFGNNLQIPLSKHSWGLQIIAIWNTKKGRVCLNAHNKDWLKELAKEIPEATWEIQKIHNHPYQTALGSGQHSGLNKFNKLPNDHPQAPEGPDKTSALISTDQPHNCNINEALQNSSSQNLTRNVKDWRDWTYTDGSLQKNEEGQDTGSGRCIPPSLERFPLCKPKRHGYNQHYLTGRASSYSSCSHTRLLTYSH